MKDETKHIIILMLASVAIVLIVVGCLYDLKRNKIEMTFSRTSKYKYSIEIMGDIRNAEKIPYDKLK